MSWRAVFKRCLIIVDWILSSVIFRRSSRAAQNPKAVLFSNLGHLGDCVISTAAISHFHSIYPDVKLGVLCSSSGQLIFSKLEYISDIYTVDHWALNREKGSIFVKIIKYLRQCFLARRAISGKKYDIGIDLRSFSGNAHVVLWLAKIDYTLGFRVFPSFVLSASFADNSGDALTEAEIHLELLRISGLMPDFNKDLIRYDLGGLNYVNPDAGDLIIDRYVVFHPISGHPSKNWDMQNWCDLVDYFTNRSINVIFTGTDSDRSLILKYIPPREGVFIDTGAKDWNEFLATVAGAALVVTVDTVTSHIASAFDVPVVVIFSGGTSPKRWGPLGDKNVILEKEQKGISYDDFKFRCDVNSTVEISVSKVISAVSKFIN